LQWFTKNASNNGSIFYLQNPKDIFATVAIRKLPIKEFIHACKGHVLLDVRSPGEYNHANIPSATSFPLFTDEERKIVGTAYKQKSREQAIKIGLGFFGPKMRKMVEEVESLVASPGAQSSKEIFVYCWRGGMRSAGVAWLLDLYGFKVHTLAGGYKAFRNYVLQTFAEPFQFRILGGYTGSGKTEVLNELESQGEVIIDLEKIASHKGSAFGSYKMPPQPRQEMFENLLAFELQEKTSSLSLPFRGTGGIWLEDEAQRIGDLNLPNALWDTMRRSPIMFLDIPFEERLDHIVEEYGDCNTEKLIDSTRRISQRLGGLDAKNTIGFLEKGEIKEAFRILLKYYDKHYLKGLHNRENLSALLTTISCKTVTPKNASLLTKPQPA
jgi:tRNA 2-selenouridine synthase